MLQERAVGGLTLVHSFYHTPLEMLVFPDWGCRDYIIDVMYTVDKITRHNSITRWEKNPTQTAVKLLLYWITLYNI